ncbi:MAG: hypothetical protein DME26_21090 [Verrucomicrobia bacterium]|nr:MAG: hypothetical protein DME26_21090 [Verrucomicrobiota bacterium]
MIFIDTGAFLARYLSRDQHHKAATALWEKIRAERELCVTSNFVLDETFTLLARRASYSFAAEKARVIYASEANIGHVFSFDAHFEQAGFKRWR